MPTVQPESLDWALAHALTEGDTDVLPPAFEYSAIHHDWGRVRAQLQREELLKWVTRPQRTLLAPKGKLGFRAITQLDPIDFLLFSALVFEVAPDIEAHRVPVADNIVFSYRANPLPSGQLYDPTIGYFTFLRHAHVALKRKPRPTHVAVTDIADFYPRIYVHRLANALQAATPLADHVTAIMRFIAGWNSSETFGIPVGSAPTRLLAEAALADIDKALLAAGIRFLRYSDDYRIFCNSQSNAYRSLAYLSDVLFRNLGLTLQPQKTELLTADEFKIRFLPTEEDREFASLQATFEELAEQLELSDSYEAIEYEELDAEQQALIDSLNLQQLLSDQLAAKTPDFPFVKFLLRRLAQLADSDSLEDVLASIDSLYPIFPDVIRYLLALSHLPSARRTSIGDTVLNLLTDSIASELPYFKVWGLHLFAATTQWNNDDRFLPLLNVPPDEFSRRKIIIAMGRAAHRYWFQSQWRGFSDFPPWTRRALLAAASCLPHDARGHWYGSVAPRLDVLERAIVAWAEANPFA
jgi:hypothetical protein